MTKLSGILLMTIAFSACAQTRESFKSPAGYDLTKPVKYNMPEDLFEVSGIVFHEGNAGMLYAEQDEDGKVYALKPGDATASHVKFAGHGDYEDIAINGNYLIMMRSDGVFYTMPFDQVQQGKADAVRAFSGLIPAGEYEGMAANYGTDEVFVLCKNCGADKKTGSVTGYILKLDASGGLTLDKTFKINTEKIAAQDGGKKMKFRPSALTFNKHLKEWFLLSSVNKMLVVTDTAWNVKQVYTLNPALFNQPEGITFDIDNNLYISNEGGNTKAGTVLKFPFGNPEK
jgi:hypothetical protein